MPIDRSSPRWARHLPAVVFGVGMAAWLVALVAVVAVSERDEAPLGQADRAPPHADAIVVLGAAQYDGRPSPVLRARLDHALALWRSGVAPRVIVTGGTGFGDTTSEAAVGRAYLVQHGVPGRAIQLEPRGRTTRQSLDAVAAMLGRAPAPQVVLVSDPFHMLRLAVLARGLGMRPYTSPTRTSPISASFTRESEYMVSESFKVPFVLLFEHGRW